jgi:hypothetical protein
MTYIKTTIIYQPLFRALYKIHKMNSSGKYKKANFTKTMLEILFCIHIGLKCV